MRRRDVLRGAAAAAVIVPSPAIRSAYAQTAKTLVIGGSVPLTGAAAETGLNVNNGYITAATYLNDVLGGVEIAGEKYRIELKLFDDASDPARATTLIQRQLDDGTDFFLGSFGSNIVLPTAAITERAKKPMVQTGGGADAIFTRGFKYVFGMFPRATRQFASAAALFKTLKPTPQTYSVIYTNDAFSKTAGEGVRLACDAAGLQRLETYELPAKVTDVSSVLASIRSKTPDILVCVMHDQDSLLIARQMVATNTNVKLLFQGLGPQLASFREALGKYSDGLCCSTYWDESVPYKDKFFGDSKKFADYYRSKFTRPIAYHVAGAAACIETYVMAMQAAKSIKPESVRDALAAANFETFYARIKFTPEGDGDALLLGGMIGQVQKGKLETVYPAEARSAEAIYPTPTWDKKA
ncbi:amino acid/amide ABC transporter substrate-binding protein, HAAT family [Enhydrobacter aerosaccus]|uniref:Amino acid/amide ABC transporter substrate-binding protein, HAAT family n=1 Tax=Enhydrobacter aerosaccus TaxID=225324 RepID=A0A1T4RX18_9HYPH|nr:amino acid ABC transporter substrate-binding protein [Enhydrobacter aerosaccus]SKA20495.1 amino acid/amide ABC transporter substrate-binding protein, HAAT family [Enhydrobacter aerosaccus]